MGFQCKHNTLLSALEKITFPGHIADALLYILPSATNIAIMFRSDTSNVPKLPYSHSKNL